MYLKNWADSFLNIFKNSMLFVVNLQFWPELWTIQNGIENAYILNGIWIEVEHDALHKICCNCKNCLYNNYDTNNLNVLLVVK